MSPPTPILIETRNLGEHPEACHLSMVVEVWRRDSWYGYRAFAREECADGVSEVDVDSGSEWYATAAAAARAGEAALHRAIAGD